MAKSPGKCGFSGRFLHGKQSHLQTDVPVRVAVEAHIAPLAGQVLILAQPIMHPLSPHRDSLGR